MTRRLVLAAALAKDSPPPATGPAGATATPTNYSSRGVNAAYDVG